MKDRQKKNRITLSVVVPARNEQDNVVELTTRTLAVFDKRNLSGEIIFVDDGSTDGTAAEVRKLSMRDSRVVLVQHPVNKGIAEAWKTGLSVARGTYGCVIDADLQYQPEDIWRLFREMRSDNADIVQGYRSAIGRLRDARYILSRTLNILLNLAFGMRLRDNKSGFVLAPLHVLQHTLQHRFRYGYFQSFILVSAVAKGYRPTEIEVLFENRAAGQSFIPKLPVKIVAKCLVDLVKGFVEFRLLRRPSNIEKAYLAEVKSAPGVKYSGWRRLAFRFYFLTMPFHKWLITRRAKDYYHQLTRTQWLTPDQIKELQLRKLKSLINHAYHHVPYYRDKLDELGIEPADITSLEDLSKLPLLTKADVRENLFFDLFSDNHNKRKVLRIKTSGSTGEPFVTFADRHQLEIRWAATQRSMEWTGYKFGDRQVRLWHQTVGMSWVQVFKERLDAFLSRRVFIPAFEISDERLENFMTQIRKANPVLIDGYAESLNFLAHYVKDKGMESVRPKAIMSSAQILPEETRKILEEVFQCEVYDKYGSREFSGIAYECDAHAGHHVVAESYIVELLKDGKPCKPGEMGEIVITDLNNLCVPLVRYRIGDLATAMDNREACRCGRGLPRIGRIEGRLQSIIVGANGSYLPGTFFAHLFKDFDQLIRQYQVIQDKEGEITLRAIKGPRFNEAGLGELVALLKKYLGEKTVIKLDWVDRIALGPNGKHQASVSRLKVDWQGKKKAA